MIGLSLSEYDPKAYDSLPDFFVSRGRLADVEAQISLFGSFICKYRFEDIVGLNLMHQHFPIDHQEVLVRRLDSEGATMRPELRSAHNDETLVPYLWMYCNVDTAPSWHPVEFVTTDHWPVAELEMLRYADALLEDLGEALISEGLADTFGLAGIHSRQGITLGADETLLENTDEENKILELRRVPIDSFEHSETTQTFWTFSDVQQAR